MSAGLNAQQIRYFKENPHEFPRICRIMQDDEKVALLTPTSQQLRMGTFWNEHDNAYILKYRQAKATTFFVLMVLGMTQYNKALQSLVIAHQQATGEEAFRRMQYAYTNLVPDIKLPLDRNQAAGSKNALTFLHGGKIQVKTGKNPEGVAGYSPDRVHLTEYGEFDSGVKEFHGQFNPSIDRRKNAKWVIETVPGDRGTHQHIYFMQCQEGRGKHRVLFLRWWLDDTCRPLSADFDPRDVILDLEEQRYFDSLYNHTPFNPRTLPFRVQFRRDALKGFLGDTALFDKAYPPDEKRGWRRLDGGGIPDTLLKQYEKTTISAIDALATGRRFKDPTLQEVAVYVDLEDLLLRKRADVEFAIVVDSAGFGSTGDPSALHLFHVPTGEEVASWSGRITPNSLANMVLAIQKELGVTGVWIFCESNKGEVLTALIALNADHVYHYEKDHPGIHANVKTNGEGNTHLMNLLQQGTLKLHCLELVNQLSTWDMQASKRRASDSEEGTHHYDRAVCARLFAWVVNHTDAASYFGTSTPQNRIIQVAVENPGRGGDHGFNITSRPFTYEEYAKRLLEHSRRNMDVRGAI